MAETQKAANQEVGRCSSEREGRLRQPRWEAAGTGRQEVADGKQASWVAGEDSSRPAFPGGS